MSNQPGPSENWTTTYLGNQIPPPNPTFPISSTDSFVVLPSGEVLPLNSAVPPVLLVENESESTPITTGNKRRVTFGGIQSTIINDDQNTDDSQHEADDLANFDEEEMDFPSDEEEDGATDAFEEDDEEPEEGDLVADDQPSTSTGKSSFPVPRSGYSMSQAMKSALLSTETQDLLEEMKMAYGNGKGKKKPRKRSRLPDTDDDVDSQDDEDQANQEFLDDPLDEEYFPQEKMRRRAAAKRRLQELAKERSRKKRKVASTSSKKSGNETTDYSDWTEGEEAAQSANGTPKRKKKTDLANLNESIADLSAWLSETDVDEEGQSKKQRFRTRTLPPEVQSLLGQANVSFAQGRQEEALKLVEEVVRSHPNYHESYDVLSMFHGVMGHKEQQLQFGALAAHLNNNCDGDKWGELAGLAVELGELDQASRCYTKAFRAKPTEVKFYDEKIKILEKMLEENDNKTDALYRSILKKIADTKLASVKGLVANKETFTDDGYICFARNIFQEFYESNDARGSVICLRSILERLKAAGDFSVEYFGYLNHLMVVAMHAKDYEAALLAVFRYSKLQAFNGAQEVKLAEDKYAERIERHCSVRPLTGDGSENLVITHYAVPSGFSVELMGRTITCWIRLKRYDCCERLLEMLQAEVTVSSAPDVYWEIAEALAGGDYYREAEKLLEKLVRAPEYERASIVWLCYAEVLSSQGNLEAASVAFSRVLQLAPNHVSARLSLSALQQQFGQVEEALQTLDIGDGRTLEPERMDERLLYHRCALLRQQESWSQFIMTGRFLLAMYFKDTYSHSAWNVASAIRYGGWKVSQTLRALVLEAVRETNWERLIKRMPIPEPDTVPADEIWDIFYQLCELMYERRMLTDFFSICSFASQCPLFLRGNHMRVVLNLLLYASILRRNAKVTWTLLRYCLPANNSNAAWNVHGILFVFSQEVRYHRFTLRAMLRIPESVPLAWLSGNNSLISGTYQHALAEYYYILKVRPDDPLLNLLCGLCNLHLATKKFIARRHDLFIQGLAFLCKYEELRGSSQEVYYNIGRALQQTGVIYAAVHYYKKALAMEPMVTRTMEDDESEEEHKGIGKSLYDLRPLIAHNLALIYHLSNNSLLARELLERYCTIE